MKNFFILLCFAVFMFLSATSFSQGIWTWMSGTNVANAPAVFGTQGVPSTNNHPQATYSPYCWTDLKGNFWLYGGSDAYDIGNADLWEFNPSTSQWTWIKGNGSDSIPPVYGTMGVPDIANTPGSRRWSACTWVDANGDLWLYGGYSSLGGSHSTGILADMWKYNIASNEWTWEAGSDNATVSPVYGTLGVASPSNTPGSREELGSSWVDANGKFWLYGSTAVKITDTCSSDMWMFDPQSKMWTWESGPQKLGDLPVYGTKGVFSASNTPGARRPTGMWKDANGHFFVFGGNDGTYKKIYADLWEYDPSINQWAWINGSQTVLAAGEAGTVCQCDTSFYPQARCENPAVWKDGSGNAWMFGGSVGYGFNVGDMWVYLSATQKWARTTSSNNTNANPVYGTLGVPSISNMPGCRCGTGHWQDSLGNFWMYGGFAGTAGQGLTDMWRYTRDSTCIASCGACQSRTGSILSSHDSICSGSGIASLLTTSNTIGGLQWQSSVNGVNYTDISGQTSGSYTTPTSLSQTTYYRLIANGGTCSDTSVAKKITVLNGSLAGSVSSEPDSLCTGTLAKLKASGNKGSIQWQSSATTSNFQNIAGATDSSLTQIPIHTTYYRIVSANGSCSDTSATFKLTVIPIPVAVFTASATGLVVTFNSSGSSGGVTSYYWNFGDGDTSDLANPVHVYSKADTFDVCLTVFNKSNCDYTTCMNVEAYPTGIASISAENNWNIYPDPFTKEFNIVATATIPIRSIEIYNVLGEMVLNKYTNMQDNVYRIDASGLPGGMYFIRISTQESDYTVPVVKQ